jgi:hypothetical protein
MWTPSMKMREAKRMVYRTPTPRRAPSGAYHEPAHVPMDAAEADAGALFLRKTYRKFVNRRHRLQSAVVALLPPRWSCLSAER